MPCLVEAEAVYTWKYWRPKYLGEDCVEKCAEIAEKEQKALVFRDAIMGVWVESGGGVAGI